MGEPLWERKGPIEGDGPFLPFLQAGAVHFSLFSLFPLLASPSLLLAPLCLWSAPQLQVSHSTFLYFLFFFPGICLEFLSV